MAAPRVATKPLAVLEYDADNVTVEPDGPATTAHVYEPFPGDNWIRLLQLLPGQGASRLECRVSAYDMDDSALPPYRAVSYTWVESKYDNLVVAGQRIEEFPGPRARYSIRHPVWCGRDRILVSTNLRDALRRFRHPTLSVELWIDAICINQGDLDERAKQVLLMPKIYHSATAVWFWLGEQDESSDSALELMTRLNAAKDQVVHEAEEFHEPTRSDIHNAHVLTKLGLAPIEASGWRQLVEFFQRPVFQRIWIVQELVTATKVVAHCGRAKIDYEMIQSAVEFLAERSWDEELSQYFKTPNVFAYVSVLGTIEREWYQNRKLIRPSLVRATRNFQATDPKDKVFALLGLFNDFAHRDHSNLQTQEAPQRPLSTLEQSGLLKVVRPDDDEDFNGVRAVMDALRELINHQAETSVRNNEMKAATIFKGMKSERMVSMRLDLITYLYHNLECLIPEVEDATVTTVVTTKIARTFLSQLDGTREERSQDAREAAQNLIEFISADSSNNSNLDLVRSFVLHVLQTFGDQMTKLKQIQAFGDAQHVHQREQSGVIDTLCHFLRLIDPEYIAFELANVENPHDSSYRGGRSPSKSCRSFCPLRHGRPVKHDAGEVSVSILAGIYLLASCSSYDEDLLAPALHHLARSTSPPHPGCSFTSSSWNTLKAFFGDLSEWDQQTDRLFRKCIIRGLADQEFVMLPDAEQDAAKRSFLKELNGKIGVQRRREPYKRTKGALFPWAWSSSVSCMPDYRLPEVEIFREFTVRSLMEDPDLFILSTIEDPSSRRITSLPSWVPDLSASPEVASLCYPQPHISIPYNAGDGAERQVDWSAGKPNELRIRGCKVGKIISITEVEEKTDLVAIVAKAQKLTASQPPKYPTGESTTDALWRTLVGNCTGAPQYQHPAPSSYSKSFEAFQSANKLLSEKLTVEVPTRKPSFSRRIFNAAKRLTREKKREDTRRDSVQPVMSKSEMSNLASLFCDAAKSVVQRRRFFVTNDGFFGLDPTSTEIGDFVSVFAGGKVPFIIRELTGFSEDGADGSTAFKFIGECYCHGYNEGQVASADGFRWEELHLR